MIWGCQKTTTFYNFTLFNLLLVPLKFIMCYLHALQKCEVCDYKNAYTYLYT